MLGGGGTWCLRQVLVNRTAHHDGNISAPPRVQPQFMVDPDSYKSMALELFFIISPSYKFG